MSRTKQGREENPLSAENCNRRMKYRMERTQGQRYTARPIDEKDEWTDWEVVNDVGVRIAVTNREEGRIIAAALNSHDALLEAAQEAHKVLSHDFQWTEHARDRAHFRLENALNLANRRAEGGV